jgi:hypothetical protein
VAEAQMERVSVATHSVSVSVAWVDGSVKGVRVEGQWRRYLPVDPSGQTSVTSTIKIFSMPTQAPHSPPGPPYLAVCLLARRVDSLDPLRLHVPTTSGLSGCSAPMMFKASW